MDTAKQLTIKNLRRKRKMAVNKVDYEVLTSGVKDEWGITGWLD